MSYAWDITVPKNTLVTDPVLKQLDIRRGVIVKAEIQFPEGCNGMVKVRILREDHQLLPVSRDEWITGNRYPVEYPMYYEVKGNPVFLRFKACSPETSYDHVITVRISVLPREVASWIPLLELFAAIARRMGVLK